MRTRHRLAVIAACSLPLVLAGCVATTPDATTVVAVAAPSPAANVADTAAATPPPASNPVEVRVVGTVLSRAGGPMLGATVSVRPASTSRDCLACAAARVITDAEGRFALTLARGNYLISCQIADGSRCRIEDGAAPEHFSVTSGSRDVVLTADPAAGPR